MFDFMPDAASSWAEKVDFINNLITYIALFCTVAIVGVMIWFGVRYRDRPGRPPSHTPPVTHHTMLEVVWTVIPAIVCFVVFYLGYTTYREMRSPPANALEIQVDAYSWRWEFKYPTGKKTTNELVVPVGKPVRLIMTSHDVLHGFFVPAMRVKEDVRPGAYSYLWFTPTKEGEFRVFCTEYCGVQHSQMLAALKVVSSAEYQDFVLERGVEEVQLPPVELGAERYLSKGCNACHSLDGVSGVGPTFKGLYGRTEVFTDGTSLVADENYLRESILYPAAKMVKGYQPVMPSYKDQLTEDEIAGLIAYIKSLSDTAQTAE